MIENLTQRFGYILNSADKYPGAPSVQVHPVDPTTTFDLCQQSIIPVLGKHHQLTVLGYRLGSFAYLTDIKTIADDEAKARWT